MSIFPSYSVLQTSQSLQLLVSSQSIIHFPSSLTSRVPSTKWGRKRTELIWGSTGHWAVKVESSENNETKALYAAWVKGI